MYRWLWLLPLGLVLCSVNADDPKPPAAHQDPAKPADSAKDEFAAIQKEWQQGQAAYMKKYQAAPAEERQKLFQTEYPKVEPFALRCVALAEKWPTAPEAVDALFWAVGNNATGDPAKKCAEQLKKLWLDKASLDEISKKLARHYYLQSPDLHQAVMTRVEKDEKDPKVIPVLMWLGRQALLMPQVTANAKKAQDLILTRFIDSKELGTLWASPGRMRGTDGVANIGPSGIGRSLVVKAALKY